MKDEKPQTTIQIYDEEFQDLKPLKRDISHAEGKDYSKCQFYSKVIRAGIEFLKKKFGV